MGEAALPARCARTPMPTCWPSGGAGGGPSRPRRRSSSTERVVVVEQDPRPSVRRSWSRTGHHLWLRLARPGLDRPGKFPALGRAERLRTGAGAVRRRVRGPALRRGHAHPQRRAARSLAGPLPRLRHGRRRGARVMLVYNLRRCRRLQPLRRPRRLRLLRRRLRDDQRWRANVLVVPIRTGVGLRLGINLDSSSYAGGDLEPVLTTKRLESGGQSALEHDARRQTGKVWFRRPVQSDVPDLVRCLQRGRSTKARSRPARLGDHARDGHPRSRLGPVVSASVSACHRHASRSALASVT